MIFLIWGRAILLGWVTLAATVFVEGLLLKWTGPLFGARWIATAQLGLDCAALAAAGWVVGRLNRTKAIPTVMVFAVTLCFWEFAGLNVPWLIHMIVNAFRGSNYLEALATGVETHVVLFGCLIAGGALSCPREKPISIAS